VNVFQSKFHSSVTSVQLFYLAGLMLSGQDFTTRTDHMGRGLNASKFADTSGALADMLEKSLLPAGVLQSGGVMCSGNRQTRREDKKERIK
jgi:hypothetical protein